MVGVKMFVRLLSGGLVVLPKPARRQVPEVHHDDEVGETYEYPCDEVKQGDLLSWRAGRPP